MYVEYDKNDIVASIKFIELLSNPGIFYNDLRELPHLHNECTSF